MGQNTVQTIGNLTISFMNPLINAGAAITLKGFKMEGDIADTTQQVMNSKIIALTGGDTATLTNNVKAGKLTLNAVRTSGIVAQGDIVALCDLLQSLPDSSGGVMTFSWSQNSATITKTFIAVTHESHPPLKISGNDLPTYACTFNYADYN
jgi:hypothetical protein